MEERKNVWVHRWMHGCMNGRGKVGNKVFTQDKRAR